MANGFNEFSLQAKVIVLGDSKVGKSSLIHNLDPQVRAGYKGSDGFGADDIIFSVIEFPISELIASPQLVNDPIRNTKLKPGTPLKSGPSVYLKIWEHNSTVSKEEEELAFRGALFCIIVMDLRSPESAKNVFSKWIAMKEKHMNDCFLFVVGTHLDQCPQRRVDIAEICKACAQKEAIYTEVSNFDGTNMILLRRLIAQRVNYVLNVRENMNRTAGAGSAAEIECEKKGGESPIHFLRSGTNNNNNNNSSSSNNFGSTDMDMDEFSEEAKLIQEHERTLASVESSGGHLNAPFLEQDLVCDSIGSILSSALGTEFWPGYEVEQEQLTHIGAALSGFVDRLTTDPKSLPKAPPETSMLRNNQSMWAAGGGLDRSNIYDIPEPDYDALKHVFDVMGFALPQTFMNPESFASPIVAPGPQHQQHQPPTSATPPPPSSASDPTSPPSNSAPTSARLQQAKLKVRLPDGSMSALIIYPGYEVVDQVDAFLVQYGMDDDATAREKLIEAATKLRASSLTSPISSANANNNQASAIAGDGNNNNNMNPLSPTTPDSSPRSGQRVLSPPTASISTPLQQQQQQATRKSIISQAPASIVADNNNAPPESPVITDRSFAEGGATGRKSPSSSMPPSAAATAAAVKTAPRTPLMVPAPTPKASSTTTTSTITPAKATVHTPTATGAGATSSNRPQSRRCKIRIQLPDVAGGAIETVVRDGQDLAELARVIATEHNLSWGYQQKVYDQLRSAFNKK